MLTTIQINALKPKEKAYKVADGKGLYLLVSPSGSLLWRVKFRFHGIEKKMALGRYAAPFIMMRQNRQQDIDRADAAADYQITSRPKSKSSCCMRSSMH
jgi:Predicted membrane protein